MSILIPDYLKDYAVLEKNRKGYCDFSIKCECENMDFEIYKSELTNEEKEEQKRLEEAFIKRFGRGFEVNSDKDGNVFYVKRNFLGQIVDKAPISEYPDFNNKLVIKIKCNKCGKEIIIFDNQEHGYNAIFCTPEKQKYPAIFKQVIFKNTVNNLAGIRIRVYNDDTLEEFIENTGIEDVSKETYLNAFSWIFIDALVRDKKNKKVKIHDEETR